MNVPEAPTTPAQRLDRLKLIVERVGKMWTMVLRRRQCMQALGRREDLHAALNQTYAAHVTNMLQDVLAMDLVREIGALVLDKDESASVTRALSALRDPEVFEALRAEYEVVPPLGEIGGDPITPDARAEIDAAWKAKRRSEQLGEFKELSEELECIEKEMKSDVRDRITTVRNKGVAHYDLVREGDSWRLWSDAGTGLTWDQLNSYIDLCTSAVDVLTLLVRRAGFSFEEAGRIGQKYVDEFIGALTEGLQLQKQREQEERERRKKDRGL